MTDDPFHFGENWQRYLAHVDDEAVAFAERGLLKLVPRDRLRGATFIDIGCGSGIHALAAYRLGAKVTAIDVDADSVAAALVLLNRYGAEADVRRESVFDAQGQFDVVYSWGVLHHTAAMWKAIEHAAGLVKPGGLFAIALYQKTPACGVWARIKRRYSKSGRTVQSVIRYPYMALLLLRLAAGGTHVRRYLRDYKSNRGMNFFTDIHDWLGGYPYESASAEEIKTFFDGLGFGVVFEDPRPAGRGVFGTGCIEFTFEKTE